MTKLPYWRSRSAHGARFHLLAGISGLAIVASAGSTALAQTSNAPAAKQTADATDAIIVTGTRLKISGFNSPTPLTTVTSARIAELGQVSAEAALNDLPQLRPLMSTTNAGQGAPVGGISAASLALADLRGLNPVRTLTLIDGRRVVPALATGSVDLNIIPSGLISNIQVLTGGASAAYGSDAVAGVVNVILNTKLRGLQGQADYGISEHGDGNSLHLSLAGGTTIGDRFSIVAGIEFRKDDRINNCFSRDWCQPGGQIITTKGGSAYYLRAPDVYFDSATFGGVLSTFGPSQHIVGQFTGNSVLSPFSLGTVTPAGAGIATPAGGYQLGGGPNGLSYYEFTDLQQPQQVVSTFTHAEYEVSNKLKLTFEGSFANNQTTIYNIPGLFAFGFIPPGLGGMTSGLPIYSSNAYLIQSNPAVAAQIAALPTFSGPLASLASLNYNAALGQHFGVLGKFLTNDPTGHDEDDTARFYSSQNTYRLMFGASGDLFGSFSWDAYYQFGYTDRNSSVSNVVNYSHLLAASDAVFSAGPGSPIVCRSTLTSPTNGCIPLNVLGNVPMTAAQRAYIFGVENDEQTYEQQVAALNIHGTLFHTWAGPAAVAFGVEHRYEAAHFTFSNPPGVLWEAGGIPSRGSENISEVYGEIGIPLMKDGPLGKDLNLDIAGRETNYPIGWVGTYKFGLVYDPTDWLKLRATDSLDVRAANLYERFAPETISTSRTVTAPNGLVSTNAVELAGGNPNLKPETSHTYTVGAVLQGRGPLLHGAQFSIDYYNINISNVIVTPPIDTGVAQECDAGVQAFCNLLTFGSNGAITQVDLRTVNLSSLKTDGLDINAQYQLPLDNLKLPGALTFQVNANYVHSFLLIQPDGSSIQYAGNTGTPTTNQGGFGVPHWLLTASVTYDTPRWGATLQARYIDKGVNDPTAVGPDGYCGQTVISPTTHLPVKSCVATNLNTVPSEVYFTLSGHYDIVNSAGRKIELFGVINNLFDTKPPFDPGQYYTDAVYFDQIGRYFRFGVRFKY